MGSIVDGQPVNASVTNNSKVDRLTDDQVYGILSLLSPSSASISDLQGTLNTILNGIGGSQTVPATGYAPVPANTISGAMNHEQAFRALAAKFYGAASAGGHSHSGADGDGALIQQTTINGLSGAVTLAPSGGAAIGISGQVINIFAPTGGGGIGMQETPSGLVDGTNAIFNLSALPSSSASIMMFVDGLPTPITTGFAASGQQITFQSGWIPQVAQTIYAFYLTGGTAATGGGSSGGPVAFGTKSVPISINPASGIVPTTDKDQVWFIKPTTSGAQSISATPPIAAGFSVGQRLSLYGVSATDYLIIPSVSGVDQNGTVNLNNAQAIQYHWNGTEWSELSRKA